VSTPALITSLVDEAVEVGSIVKLMDLAHGRVKLIEVTLAASAPAVVRNLTLDELELGDAVRVVAVVRSDQPMTPVPTMHFLEHDHVIVLAREDATYECSSAFIG
jgi:trk system potassium uptake protein TrkA